MAQWNELTEICIEIEVAKNGLFQERLHLHISA